MVLHAVYNKIIQLQYGALLVYTFWVLIIGNKIY